MSETKKTVKITESELVTLIDKLVTESVELEKKKWIAEQENKEQSLLEERISKLEAKLNQK